jgi:hypothetical protein
MQATITTSAEEHPWPRIISEVNAWRGACLQAFARAEAAVSETLLFLSGVGERGTTVQLRHLVGQRLEDLAQALGTEGAFKTEGNAAPEALENFRKFEGLRVHLAHDVARIAVERNGCWVVVFRHLSVRSRIAQRSTIAFEQDEAVQTLSDLKRKVQQLETALINLRRVLEG